MRRSWWWNDPETRAWIAGGACGCRACKRDRRLIGSERPMPKPKTPDPALPNEAGRLPPQIAEALIGELDRLDEGQEIGPHEHVYRCQDCGEIGRGLDHDGADHV